GVLHAGEVHLAIAAGAEAAAAIVELDLRRALRPKRVPVLCLARFLDAIARPRRGVRRDAERIRPQRLEARPRDVEVLQVEQLQSDVLVSLVPPEPSVERLELAAAVGHGAEGAADGE